MLRRAAAVFLLLIGLYGLTFHGYVDIEDSEVCYLATKNLVDHGDLSIGHSAEAQRIADARFFVASGGDGRTYPIYPLAQLLLPAPLVWGGEQLGGLARSRPDDLVRMAYAALDVPLGALIGVVILLIGRRLGQSPTTATGSALVGGAATMLWPYAQSTFADVPLTLFASLSTWCLLSVRGERRDLGWIVAAGVCSGLAVLLRPAGALLLLPACLFLRRRGRSAWVALLLPVGVLVAGATWIDLAVLGRPAAASYAGFLAESAPVLTHSYGLSLFGLLFSDGKGLLVLSPPLLLALLAWPRLRRADAPAADLILGNVLVLALFFAAFDGWYGGWCWGPRYLLPAVPPLAALAGCWLPRRGIGPRTVTVVAVVAGLAIQGLAIAVPHRIHMTVTAVAGGADLTQYFFYPRSSPIRSHALILAHKLGGGDECYSKQQLFGVGSDVPVDVTAVPATPISAYNEGFRHFAWVRVFEKGHPGAAVAGVVGSLLAMLLSGLWLVRAGFKNRGE